LRSCIAFREKALGSNHPDVAGSLNNLGFLYKKQGQYAQAEMLYMRSLAILEKTLGQNHPDVVNSLVNIAALYRKTGREADAVRIEERIAASRAIKQ
jgi:tetratricopeptide (TPR) repeat protein